jgi:uncharacterized protein (DUF362 family)
MKKFVKPGDKVVIKPNMSFARRPEQAANTHPEVVRELAVMCQEAGASQVLVLDNVLHMAKDCFEMSGIPELCENLEKTRVELITSSRLFKKTLIPNAQDMTENRVMREVLDSDVLIAAPVAKSHSGAGVSLSLKGMMGLIYDRGVMHGRYDLDTSIVDLGSILKADLTVIDASRVLATNGPYGPGDVIRADTIIASTDQVAADAMTVSMFPWYGQKIKPKQVRHIRLAADRGLGRMDLENLQIKRISS